MNEYRPGMERRLKRDIRRISSQHRQLDEMYAQLLRALDGRVTRRAQDALENLGNGLSAHFALEEKHTFPAVQGSHPEHESELLSLTQEHQSFRDQISRLGSLLEKGDWLGCDETLDELALALAQHEGREERLLEGLDGVSPAKGD